MREEGKSEVFIMFVLAHSLMTAVVVVVDIASSGQGDNKSCIDPNESCFLSFALPFRCAYVGN